MLTESLMNLKVEHTLLFTDIESLKRCSKEGCGTEGFEFTIESISKYNLNGNDVKINLYRLNRKFDDNTFYLFVFSDCDGELIYFGEIVPGFLPGLKAELVNERELYGLFDPPDDENNFSIPDLTYAKYPNLSIEFDEEVGPVNYEISPHCEKLFQKYGNTIIEGENIFTQLFHYDIDSTESGYDQMFLFEEGGVSKDLVYDPDGGVVTIYVVRSIEETDIKYF